MTNLSDKTSAELDKMLKADIIAEILDGMTRTTSKVIQDPKLGNIHMEETTTDAYGKVLSVRIIEWTYYPTGEVDEITVTDDKERIVVKHYTDGKQPIAIKKPIKSEPLEPNHNHIGG